MIEFPGIGIKLVDAASVRAYPYFLFFVLIDALSSTYKCNFLGADNKQ